MRIQSNILKNHHMSIFNKLSTLFDFFKKKSEIKTYEKSAWGNFKIELLNMINEDLQTNNNDQSIFICYISNTLKNMDSYSHVKDYDTTAKNSFANANSLSETGKNILSKYISLVLNKNYKLTKDDSYKFAMLYFYKLYINVFYKWHSADLKTILDEINGFNKLSEKYNVKYNPLLFHNKDCYINYSDFKIKIFSDSNQDIYPLIEYLENLLQEYSQLEEYKQTNNSTLKISQNINDIKFESPVRNENQNNNQSKNSIRSDNKTRNNYNKQYEKKSIIKTEKTVNTNSNNKNITINKNVYIQKGNEQKEQNQNNQNTMNISYNKYTKEGLIELCVKKGLNTSKCKLKEDYLNLLERSK